MSIVEMTIPKDFDWKSEEGEVMNLLLNMMGGLAYSDLTVEEKELLLRHGYKETTND